jgi:MFS transporter, putative metabolite:H+ symporter
VASTYISEILRADRRGGSFLSYQIIFPVGLLGAGIAGAVVVPTLGWQWMFIIGAVPALISLVLRRYCPESPRWLAQKGRLDEAEKVLEEIERRVSRNGRDPLPPVVPIETPALGTRTRWQELFQGQYRMRTFVVWVLWAATYLVSQGMQSWIPTLYREVYHLTLQQSLN